MNLEDFLTVLEESGAIPKDSTPKIAIMAIARIYRIAADMSFDAGYSQCSVDFSHIANELSGRYVNLNESV